jgi:hypothetical protein
MLTLAALLLAGCDNNVAGPESDLAAEPAAATEDTATEGTAFELSLFGDPSGCETGTQSTGATFEICFPDLLEGQFLPWNRFLLVYAHGYQDPSGGPRLPSEAEDLAGLVLPRGFAFATTSYSKAGLAIEDGVNDVRDLVRNFTGYVDQAFGKRISRPEIVVVAGASEGALVAALITEQFADVSSNKPNKRLVHGGAAVCGPIGSFTEQTNYFGDFLVVFNYFFPHVFNGLVTPASVATDVITAWSDDPASGYPLAVAQALAAEPEKAAQLRDVTGLPVRDGSMGAIVESALQVLYYNVNATNDAVATLGGLPFDNARRTYSGSLDDEALNDGVARYRADRIALRTINKKYTTSGALKVPLETMTTSLDAQVPAWQQDLYRKKVIGNGLGSIILHGQSVVGRYGHCTFEEDELLGLFNRLLLKVAGQQIFTTVSPQQGVASAGPISLSSVKAPSF